MRIPLNAPDPTKDFIPVQRPDYPSYEEERLPFWRNRAIELERERDALIKANDELLAKLKKLNVSANWTGYDA